MLVFYFFAAIVICLQIRPLRSGFTFAAYVRRELARKTSGCSPFVSVIAPCRGLDDGLRENLSALFKQDYPPYEIVFVTDRADDPSLSVIKKLIEDESKKGIDASIVIAGKAVDCGQEGSQPQCRGHESLSALGILVFVDSDGRPHPEWLKTLVAPLGVSKSARPPAIGGSSP